MKISTSDNGQIVITELYNGADLVTSAGDQINICMQDTGFLLTYNQIEYDARHGQISARINNTEVPEKVTFQKALTSLINLYNKEADSNTPDFILAEYLVRCMALFAIINHQREAWYGVEHMPGGAQPFKPGGWIPKRHHIVEQHDGPDIVVPGSWPFETTNLNPKPDSK